MLVHSVGELAVEVGTGAGSQATHINAGTAKIWIRAKMRFIINSKDKGLFVHCTTALHDPETYNSRASSKEQTRNWK